MVRPVYQIWFLFLLLFSVGMVNGVVAKDNTATPLRVMIFNKAPNYYHECIPVADSMVRKICSKRNWSVVSINNSSLFTDTGLARFDVVVWNNNCALDTLQKVDNTILNNAEKQAFTRFVANGGGYVGLHGAAWGDYAWTWFTDLIGAHESRPTYNDTAIITAETKDTCTQQIPKNWKLFEEVYVLSRDVRKVRFSNPGDSLQILLSAKLIHHSDYDFSGGHPISWRHTFEGGRVFHTAIGHFSATYRDTIFARYIALGIEWAGKRTQTVSVEKKISSPTSRALASRSFNQKEVRKILCTSPTSLKIFDTFGRQVKLYNDMSGSSGIYLVRVPGSPDVLSLPIVLRK